MKLLFYSFRTLTMLRVRLIMLLWLMAMGGAWLGTAPILSVVKDGTEHATLTAQFAPLPERLGVALALGLHERLEPLAPTVLLFVVLGGIWSIFVMGAIYGLLEREGQGSSPPLLSSFWAEGGRLFTRSLRMTLGGWGLTLLLLVPGMLLKKLTGRMAENATLETSVMWMEGLTSLVLMAGFLLARTGVELARAQVLVTGGAGVLRALWRALLQVLRSPFRRVGAYLGVQLVPLLLVCSAMLMRAIGAETASWPTTLVIGYGYLGLLWWWIIPVTLASYHRQLQQASAP